jgi:hypothetical protein
MSLEYPSLPSGLSGRWKLSEIHSFIKNGLWPTTTDIDSLSSCDRCGTTFGGFGTTTCLATGLYDVVVSSVPNPSGALPPNPIDLEVGQNASITPVWLHNMPLNCYDPPSQFFKLWTADPYCGTGITNVEWHTSSVDLTVIPYPYPTVPTAITPSDSGVAFSPEPEIGPTGCPFRSNSGFMNWEVRWRRIYEDWTLDEKMGEDESNRLGTFTIAAKTISDSGIANGLSGWSFWNNLLANQTINKDRVTTTTSPSLISHYFGVLPTGHPSWNHFTINSTWESNINSSGCYWFPILQQKIYHNLPTVDSKKYWTLENSSDQFYGTDGTGIYVAGGVNSLSYVERGRVDIIKYCPADCSMEVLTDQAISGVDDYIYNQENVGTYIHYNLRHAKTQLWYNLDGSINTIPYGTDPDIYCSCSKGILNGKYIGTESCSFSYVETAEELSFVDGTTGCYLENIDSCAIKKGLLDSDTLAATENVAGAICEYGAINEGIYSCTSHTSAAECEENCGYCKLNGLNIDTGGITVKYPLGMAVALTNSGIMPSVQGMSSDWPIYNGDGSYVGELTDYINDPGSYSPDADAYVVDGFPFGAFSSRQELECDLRRNFDYYGEAYVTLEDPIQWSTDCCGGDGYGPSGIIDNINASLNKTDCDAVAATYNSYDITWESGQCCGTNFYSITPADPIISEFYAPCFEYTGVCPICSENIIFSGYYEMNMLDICREPDPTAYTLNVGEIEYVTLADCGQCTFAGLNLYDITDANSYETLLEETEWGVPIDIDSPCDQRYVDKDTFTLYFPARYGNSAVPVISGIWYDTSVYGSQDIFKITTQNSPEELRLWTCRYLRFASKNGSGASATLTYNWPYNDLYWSYCEASSDVPINLVPC